MNVVNKPCPDCPFSRECEPGALGGSTPDVYIGQIHGPFALPCHKHCDFSDPDWKSKSFGVPQCAGAAVFRTHVGVADKMPKEMPILPANSVVFRDEAEFLAHHTSMQELMAKTLLTPAVIKRFARQEWDKVVNAAVATLKGIAK